VAASDVEQEPAAFGMVVELPDGRQLGRLDGFMVDPEQHRLRYYVVTQLAERSQRLAMVPFVPASLDAVRRVIRLLDDADAQPL
jgi:hypothetical protein